MRPGSENRAYFDRVQNPTWKKVVRRASVVLLLLAIVLGIFFAGYSMGWEDRNKHLMPKIVFKKEDGDAPVPSKKSVDILQRKELLRRRELKRRQSQV
ncbi:MAG: hypothetical protein ACTSSP_02860 [Candidatus Asgardarchaeia archaeon]